MLLLLIKCFQVVVCCTSTLRYMYKHAQTHWIITKYDIHVYSVGVQHTIICFYCRQLTQLAKKLNYHLFYNHLTLIATHLRKWFRAKSSRAIPWHETAITWFSLFQRWRNLLCFSRFRCLWSFRAWRFLCSSFVLFLWSNCLLWTLFSVSNWSLGYSSCCFRCGSCCHFNSKLTSRCGLWNTLWYLWRVKYMYADSNNIWK